MRRIFLAFVLIIGLVLAQSNETTVKQFTPFWDAPTFNFTAIILWSVGFCLLFPLGWFIGRLQDLNQRCKWMRLFLKKDYRLLKHKFPGSKITFTRIICVENSTIEMKGKLWVITPNRMYLESNQKVSLNIKAIDRNPSYDDACPVIYVDDENFTALEFVGDGTGVRPQELGATLSGYFMSQMKKALMFVKNLQTILLVIMFCAVVAMIFAYLAHQDGIACNAKMDYVQGVLNGTIQTTNTIVGPDKGVPQVIKQGT